MYIHIDIYMIQALMKKGAMNLKQSNEGYKEGLEGVKRKKKYYNHYNLKNKL